MAILIDKFILELRLKTTICKNSQIIECVHVIASLQEQKAPALLSYKIPLPLMHINSWLDRSFPHFKVKIKVVASNVFSVDGNKPGIFKNVFLQSRVNWTLNQNWSRGHQLPIILWPFMLKIHYLYSRIKKIRYQSHGGGKTIIKVTFSRKRMHSIEKL